MPNVMAALGQEPPKMYIYCTSPGDGQTSCKVWLASAEWHHCSNEAKMRNLLKFAGVPQTNKMISGISGPKFTILWGHVGDIAVEQVFFPTVDMCLSCENIARESCAMVLRWWMFGDFLCPVFSVSHMQCVSDLHPKFALRPHHVWKYGRHPICNG